MKRKLIALGASALFAAPMIAQADTSNVTVYGTLNLDYEHSSVYGSQDQIQPRMRLNSNSSNFGIKGTEDLGNDWKGIWQVESAVNLQGANTSTTVAPGGTSAGFLGSTIASRNSFLGVASPYGTLSYGIYDTPFKSASLWIEPFYATGVGSMSAILGSGVMGAASITSSSSGNNGNNGGTAAASFDRRQGQQVSYTSPTFMGATLRLAYSGNNDKSPAFPDPSLWGGSVTYDVNGIYAAYAYEHHSDFKPQLTATALTTAAAFGAVPSTSDDGHKVAVGYRFNEKTLVGAVWDNLSYGQQAADPTSGALTNTSTSRNAFVLTGTYGLTDAFTLRAGLGMAMNVSTAGTSTDSSGAKMLALGGSYSFSKRTDVYLVYSRIYNDSNSAYNFGINPSVGAVAGFSPQALGLGFRHWF